MKSIEKITHALEQSQQQKTVKKSVEVAQRLGADVDPRSAAACTISCISDGADPVKLLPEIKQQCDRIKSGDLSGIEEMLYAQSLTAQNLFNRLTSLGMTCLSSPSTTERGAQMIQLALKAQNQSRQTLLALANIKNPRKSATFIRTAIAQQIDQQFNQQLNLEHSTHAAMDTGSPQKTVRTNPQLEALGIEYGSVEC
jgi:hypothetical protein